MKVGISISGTSDPGAGAWLTRGAGRCTGWTGCVVAGTVTRSVLGPGVVVEAGAEVHESIVCNDTVVRGGAKVTRSIIDGGCELADGARVGDESVALDDPDAIPIVGRESRVSSTLPAGARLAPGTTA